LLSFLRFPPVMIFAPFATASCTCSSRNTTYCSATKGPKSVVGGSGSSTVTDWTFCCNCSKTFVDNESF